MKEDSERLVMAVTHELLEDWETFGAPEGWAERELSIERFCARQVLNWPLDMLGLYEDATGIERGGTMLDGMGHGINAAWTLARLVRERLGDTGTPTKSGCEPDRCPECGSTDIVGGSVEIESGQAWQEVTCCECDHTWRDVYKLAFQEDAD